MICSISGTLEDSFVLEKTCFKSAVLSLKEVKFLSNRSIAWKEYAIFSSLFIPSMTGSSKYTLY